MSWHGLAVIFAKCEKYLNTANEICVSIARTLAILAETLDPTNINSAVATKSRKGTGKHIQQSCLTGCLNYFFELDLNAKNSVILVIY